jgi:AcrR family transcriptional regulator
MPYGATDDQPARRRAGKDMTAPRRGARERVLRTAYELFRDHGVQAVGIDRIVAEAGVAKTTLYHHFPSKDELAIATLELREQVWTRDWLANEVERRGHTPTERLLAIFDVFDEWFRRRDFEGCFFINTLLELRDGKSPVGAASVNALAHIRDLVGGYAEEAGVKNPETFAREWQVLMSGTCVVAMAGDADAATRARTTAVLILEREGVL